MNDLTALASWAQIVSVPLAVIAILVAIWTMWYQRRKKALSKEISLIAVTNFPDESTGELQLFFDGKPVDRPYLAVIRLYNTGNLPITASDFMAPLRFKFGEQCEILDAQVISKEPDGLNLPLQIHAATVELQPDLLNPKDKFALQVLGARMEFVKIDARIVGIREILDLPPIVPEAGDFILPALFISVLAILALVFRSPFMWGFLTAGVVGFVLQRIRLYTIQRRKIPSR